MKMMRSKLDTLGKKIDLVYLPNTGGVSGSALVAEQSVPEEKNKPWRVTKLYRDKKWEFGE